MTSASSSSGGGRVAGGVAGARFAYVAPQALEVVTEDLRDRTWGVKKTNRRKLILYCFTFIVFIICYSRAINSATKTTLTFFFFFF